MKKFAVVLVLVVVSAFLFTAGCQKKAEKTQTKAPTTQKLTGVTTDMLAADKCVVCGKALTNESIVDTVIYEGKVYGLDTPGEKEKFKADPAKYVAQLESGAEHPQGQPVEEEHPQGKEKMN